MEIDAKMARFPRCHLGEFFALTLPLSSLQSFVIVFCQTGQRVTVVNHILGLPNFEFCMPDATYFNIVESLMSTTYGGVS